MLRTILAVLAVLPILAVSPAKSEAIEANSYCRALAGALDRSAPSGPTFVRSYEPGPDEQKLPGPLQLSAFTYDNALAATAFVACGDVADARRIADAIVLASTHDRSGDPIRLRNAYRPGAVTAAQAKLPGWWDAKASRWYEDAYQDGTATGNVAWAALALLNVNAVAPDPRYLDTARDLLLWIGAVSAPEAARGGYAGGLSGFDGKQETLRWESTEHNVDVAAAAAWAGRLTGDSKLEAMAKRASAFVAARFDPSAGKFAIGTKPDGADADPRQLALDAQVWPILGVPDAPADWRKAVLFAYANLRAGDGMTFAGLGKQHWNEGTAQAALSLHAIGDDDAAKRLLASLPRSVAPSGLLYATDQGEAATGLKVEAEGGGDFKYYHRPHLGATAWAALATARWNPFTGKRL